MLLDWDLNKTAAVRLVNAGLPVIPCQSMGAWTDVKIPLIRNWEESAITDPEEVHGVVWRKFWNAAPGIPLGRVGMLAIDPDNHGGIDGVANWLELIKDKEMPPHPISYTPRGRHCWFRQRADRPPLGNSDAGLKGLGINVRGKGGFVIAPGTTLTVGGKKYRYTFEHDLSLLLQAPELPLWLYDMLAAGRKPEPKAPPAAKSEPVGGLSSGDIERSRYYWEKCINDDLAEFAAMPNVDGSGRNNALRDAAFRTAGWIAAGVITREWLEDKLRELAAKCGMYDNNKSETEAQIERTLQGSIDSGVAKKPRSIREADALKPSTVNAEKLAENAAKKAEPQPKEAKNGLPAIYGADQLQGMYFDPLKYVCDDLLVEGCSILAGRPKMGKSWLALDLSFGIASGGQVMSKDCKQGDVLYCALEDNQRRMQDRLRQIERHRPWPNRLKISHDWAKGPQAITQFKAWADSAGNPRLVIVDTLHKVKSPPKGKRDAYTEDYEALELIHTFSKETRISTLLITHTRKTEADDPFDTVMGSLGVTGAVDNILVLQRGQNGMTKLLGKGRDMMEYTHAVAFDRDTCKWQITGDPDEIELGVTMKAVLDCLKGSSQAVLNKDIQTATKLDYRRVNNALLKLREKGLASSPFRGMWTATWGARAPE
jgi:hypothetical protein